MKGAGLAKVLDGLEVNLAAVLREPVAPVFLKQICPIMPAASARTRMLVGPTRHRHTNIPDGQCPSMPVVKPVSWQCETIPREQYLFSGGSSSRFSCSDLFKLGVFVNACTMMTQAYTRKPALSISLSYTLTLRAPLHDCP